MPEPLKLYPPADVVAYVLADIAIILIAARIVGTLFERVLKQPRIVGEIIAGILIGPTVLGGGLGKAATAMSPALEGTGLTNDLYPLPAFAFLNTIGQIALVFYMFLVGLEIDKRLLKGRGRQMVIMAVAATVVPVGFGFLIGGILDSATWKPEGVSTTTFSLFMGAGLSVTAFPVMARILQEKGLLGSPMGAVGVGSTAILSVLMFLVIAAAAASAKSPDTAVSSTGVKFLYVIGLTVLLFVVVRPLFRLIVDRWFNSTDKTLDGNLLAALLVGALATGFAADRILGAALVGGFLFGLAVPDKEGLPETVIARLDSAVILFFLPIFLAVSGLRTDLTLIEGSLIGGILLFLALMIVGKIGAGYIAGRAVGLDNREAQAIGVLLNCRGLLILVVALIGLQLGVITPQTQIAFVVGAIVTTMMTGPLVDRLLPKREVERLTAEISPADFEQGRRVSQGTAVIAG